MALRVANSIINAIVAVDPPRIASEADRFLLMNSLDIRYKHCFNR